MRQVNGENGPATGICTDDDFTALRGHEAADNGKSESQSSGPSGIAPLKFLEHSFGHFGRKPGAAVSDGEKKTRAAPLNAGGEKNRGVRWRVQCGIKQQIGQ